MKYKLCMVFFWRFECCILCFDIVTVVKLSFQKVITLTNVNRKVKLHLKFC